MDKITENQDSVPLTLHCVKGEEWPTTSFLSYIEALHNPLTEDSVVFTCPANHRFTLKQALKKGIFTPEQGEKLMTEAKKQKEKYYNSEGRWISQPSNIVPTKEIEGLGLFCIRCNEAVAQFVASGIILHEDKKRWQEFALCLQCAADWSNYDKGEAFRLLFDRTYGRPRHLFWQAVFKRFCQGEPSLNQAEAEKLLEDCRRQAKLSAKKHKKR